MEKTLTMIYEADKPNCNGRIYPKEVLRKAFDEYEDTISKRRALGEFGLNYPSDYTINGEISLSKASHIITGYDEIIEGFIITCKILNTPHGRILKELINNPDMEFRFGIKGYGDVQDGVVQDLKIVSIDVHPVK